MNLRSEVSDDSRLKFCIHLSTDKFPIIPMAVVFLNPGESHHWVPAPSEERDTYMVKIFHPQIFDQLLFDQRDVKKDAVITVTGNLGFHGDQYHYAVS